MKSNFGVFLLFALAAQHTLSSSTSTENPDGSGGDDAGTGDGENGTGDSSSSQSPDAGGDGGGSTSQAQGPTTTPSPSTTTTTTTTPRNNNGGPTTTKEFYLLYPTNSPSSLSMTAMTEKLRDLPAATQNEAPCQQNGKACLIIALSVDDVKASLITLPNGMVLTSKLAEALGNENVRYFEGTEAQGYPSATFNIIGEKISASITTGNDRFDIKPCENHSCHLYVGPEDSTNWPDPETLKIRA